MQCIDDKHFPHFSNSKWFAIVFLLELISVTVIVIDRKQNRNSRFENTCQGVKEEFNSY